MKNNWAVALGVITLACAPSVFAAESTVAAIPVQQGMAATGHSGHGEHAGAMPGRGDTGKSTKWTAFPTLKTKMSGENRERRMINIVPQGIAASSIDAYSNNAADAQRGYRQLPLGMAGAKLDKPESGGYHWLAAREEQDGQVRIASMVHYFGESGAINPTAMFMRRKYELEIIPQPYPREHSRYRADEDWKFLVRFNSNPLAGQRVRLETANGSKAEFASDAQGVITVRIPNDFKAETEKKTAGRRSADFVLATEYSEDGRSYLTAFNASYGTDAFYQRNLALGLGFTLLGMIGAAPLLRQRRQAETASDRSV